MKSFAFCFPALLIALACKTAEQAPATPAAPGIPADPPAATASLVGDYAAGGDSISLREAGGRLEAVLWKDTLRVTAVDPVTVTGDSVSVEGRSYQKLALGPASGNVFRITPRAPYDELMKAALAATPPEGRGRVPAKPDLVELVEARPDDQARHPLRRARTTSWARRSTRRPRAFLQRPAAEALVRAHQRARRAGLRPADPRRLPALVRHQDVLGRHAGRAPRSSWPTRRRARGTTAAARWT